MTYEAAVNLDKARAGDQPAQTRVDFMTPIVKSWCTDMACEVASIGVQVHGGMGFVEETGAAQYYRDARILPIYEGTNGIQANDLVFRKILRDKGAAFHDFYTDLKASLKDYKEAEQSLSILEDVMTAFKSQTNLETLAFIAVPILNGLGYLKGAQMMLKMDAELKDFYMKSILPKATSHLLIVTNNL